MEQEGGETVAQFVTRLRHVIEECDYSDQAGNQIRDQVVQQCKSHELRKKLLEKGENSTLELLLSTAAITSDFRHNWKTWKAKKLCEFCPWQAGGQREGACSASMLQMWTSRTFWTRPAECPAKGKTSHKCGGADQFGSQCKTNTAKPPKPRREKKPKPNLLLLMAKRRHCLKEKLPYSQACWN